MPGLLSCVSGLLDPGTAEADTLKSQWPFRNLEGRKSPVSKLKANTHAADQSDFTERLRNRSQKAHNELTPRGLG